MKNGTGRGHELPVENMRGAAWMIASAVCFAVSTVGIKKIGGQVPSSEIVFLRCLAGMLLVLPPLMKQGLGVFRTDRPGLHVIRVVCSTVSMIAAYYAITHLPLATAVSLNFTRPLFMIIVAMIFLGEVVRWRRGIATVIGFIGVVVMLGPSDLAFEPAALAALGGALAVSGALAVIRQQAAIEGPMTLFVWFTTGTTLLAFFPAMLDWKTPTGEEWAYLVGIGLTSSVGQFLLIKAFMHGEATVMNPIDYSQIVLAAVFGYFVFGEIPSIWTALGAAIIVSSTIYILFRAAKVSKRLPPPTLQE
jgi:drug/metabolite transporter (DMT)-like permease